MLRRRLPVTLLALAALLAVPAGAHTEGSASDPCEAARERCALIASAYGQAMHLVNSEPAEGLEGLLKALLRRVG